MNFSKEEKYKEIINFIKSSKFYEALNLLTEFKNLYVNDIHFNNLIGFVYQNLQDYNNANKYFLKSYQINNNNFEYLSDRVYPLCLAYFEEKKLPTYLANFERVIKPFFSATKTIH